MRPSIAERILYEFEHNVTEVHRRAIETTLGITAQQFDEHIAKARDLGVELDPPLRITPIYERDGWWTCRPTERIMAIAVNESLKRNLGEQLRIARVLTGTRLAEFSRYAAAAVEGTLSAYLSEHADLLDVSEWADYVVGAIDNVAPRLFVRRDKAEAA
jgi:hypothetical protein